MGMYKWQDMLEKYKYHESASFTGGVSDERIKLVEQELRVNLPESYKCFLREYGYGSVFGVLIEGCCLSNINSVVDLTKESREMGMPDDFVVVMHCDEYQECLQTSKMIGDECPVKNWCFWEPDAIYNTADTFSSFFEDELREGEENWD